MIRVVKWLYRWLMIKKESGFAACLDSKHEFRVRTYEIYNARTRNLVRFGVKVSDDLYAFLTIGDFGDMKLDTSSSLKSKMSGAEIELYIVADSQDISVYATRVGESRPLAVVVMKRGRTGDNSRDMVFFRLENMEAAYASCSSVVEELFQL